MGQGGSGRLCLGTRRRRWENIFGRSRRCGAAESMPSGEKEGQGGSVPASRPRPRSEVTTSARTASAAPRLRPRLRSPAVCNQSTAADSFFSAPDRRPPTGRFFAPDLRSQPLPTLPQAPAAPICFRESAHRAKTGRTRGAGVLHLRRARLDVTRPRCRGVRFGAQRATERDIPEP
jgi:hypothetical protein